MPSGFSSGAGWNASAPSSCRARSSTAASRTTYCRLAERRGLGTLAWGPPGQGMLTGRVRKGQQNDLSRACYFKHLNDERRIDVVEQLIPLADEAGLPLTHLAMAFTIAHPGVTSTLLGARTMR
ncbi:aldo/keto reductase [Micromonospora sp. KC721]|uniref:aldo/keto reductase n=1 Tax=Micromonospora sp. KC721 TaxID=2530380 RepID=UPI00210F544E|nr:aldo/keto reductase [Micromonospora sp. KC721]